jgi:hypothetical protein
MVGPMFDGRIYRAAFVPLLLIMVIVGFSLASRTGPLRSTLAPDAFDGARAFAGLQYISGRFPNRLPGSVGDDRLAAYVAGTLQGLGGPAATAPTSGSSTSVVGGGFQVTTRQISAQTIDGTRMLTTVIAERPGSTDLSPIAIVAHRDAVGRGSAAELSGTAVLLELARVLSQSETRRTIVLVSTSGGSGGYAGAADFARHPPGSLDAAIVLGDLAGSVIRKPFVLPFSNSSDAAPESLQVTFDGAISQEVGTDSGAPSTAAQLAHLAFPLSTGEESPLNAAGIPSVLVQVSGERGPSAGEQVSATRLLNFGRAVLSATYALDEGPNIATSSGPHVLLGRKLLPGWTIRLLVLALILPPLLVGVDAFARLRRRREPVRRWLAWVLLGGLPFLLCAIFAILLGVLGVVAAPASQLLPGALSTDGSAPGAVASSALVLLLALLAWPVLIRRLALPLRPSAEGAALAVLLVLLAVALLAWVLNPFACLLLVPAMHLWLLAAGAGRQAPVRGRLLALCTVLLGLLPLALLLFVYARELGIGPGGLAESAVLALAGGQVGPLRALLWSASLGCVLTALLLAPSPESNADVAGEEWLDLSTRGPSSYAGPGSLGGTESALRR